MRRLNNLAVFLWFCDSLTAVESFTIKNTSFYSTKLFHSIAYALYACWERLLKQLLTFYIWGFKAILRLEMINDKRNTRNGNIITFCDIYKWSWTNPKCSCLNNHNFLWPLYFNVSTQIECELAEKWRKAKCNNFYFKLVDTIEQAF